MAHSSNFLVTVHAYERKELVLPNPSVENNLASSLLNCNKIVNDILSEL